MVDKVYLIDFGISRQFEVLIPGIKVEVKAFNAATTCNAKNDIFDFARTIYLLENSVIEKKEIINPISLITNKATLKSQEFYSLVFGDKEWIGRRFSGKEERTVRLQNLLKAMGAQDPNKRPDASEVFKELAQFVPKPDFMKKELYII
jgi:hypothetical protein